MPEIRVNDAVLHYRESGAGVPVVALHGSASTGALFRPSLMREYSARAGYSSVEVAPVTHDLFRFFVVRP